MKNLKKFFAVLVVLALMVSSLVVPASAADNYSYADQAQKLNDLGLYKGTSTEVFNPDLGSTLNRETGVVMLLRIVGLEKAALDMSAADVTAALSKFKDAKDISPWAKNQVAYGVKNGLIVGTTATTFGPKASLDSKAYCTLILRQLGYTVEAGEQYNAAAATLQEKGGLTEAEAAIYANKSPLIKDDLVGISYGALKAVDKDGKVLFVKLIDAGVITAEAAGKNGLETAKIASVKAENGKVTVTFDKAPVLEPTAADFTVTQTVYGSDAATVTATVYYSADTKTAELTVAPVAQASAEQKVTMGVSFKGGAAVSAAEFVVPALATYDVKSVAAIANKKVEVLLNAEVTSTNKADFAIKDASGAALAVDSAFLSVDKKSIVIGTAAQTANTLYTLTTQGKDYKFVGIEAETDKPELTSAVALKNNKVELTYNERIDEASAFTATNYSIAGLTVSAVEYGKDTNGDTDKTKVVLITSSQTSGTIYKVVVTNVTDLAGNVINADKDEYQFGGLPADTDKPKLSSALAKTNTKVEATFSEEMDKTKAETVTNYTIAGLDVLKAELDKTAKIVTLTTKAQTSGTIYKLVVANVTDEAANTIDADNDEYQFGGVPADTDKPKLDGAVAKTNTTVELTFNEEMDEVSAENIANYSIAGLTITKAVLNSDASDATKNKIVTLTTSAQAAGTIYKVVVTNAMDISNNTVNSDNDEFQFGGMPADTEKPKLVKVVANDNKTVQVQFNEAMDATLATATYCYYMGSELGYPTKVVKDTVVTDGTTWNLTTKSQSAKVYTMTVSYITDTSNNVINSDNDEKTFAGIGAVDTTKPQVASAIALNKNTVKITFNEEMKNDAALTTVTNYKFTLSSGSDGSSAKITGVANAGGNPTKVVVADDKKSVTVNFGANYMSGGAVYNVQVLNVTDNATVGNVIDSDHDDVLFAGLSTDNPAPKIASIIAVNDQTIKIIFSEKVKLTSDLVLADIAFSPAFGTTLTTCKLSDDGTYVTLYYTGASKLASGTVYTATLQASGIAKITDEFDAAFSATADDQKGTFAGIPTAQGAPKVSTIVAIDKNTFDLTFDQPVNKALVETLTDGDLVFTYNSTGTAKTVDIALVRTEGDAGNKIRVFLDDSVAANALAGGTVYKVTIPAGAAAKVVNLNGTTIGTTDNSALLAAISTANAAPTLSAVSEVNNVTLKVVFSEKVDAATVNAADFTLVGMANGAVVQSVAPDASDDTGKTFLLTLDQADNADGVRTLNVTGSDIKDEAGVGNIDVTSSVDFAYNHN